MIKLVNISATLHHSKFITKSLHLLLFAVYTNLCLAGENKPDLDDPATLKRILAEAIKYEDLDYGDGENEDLLCAPRTKTPYTGWAKIMNSKRQAESLEHYKDGKQHGLEIMWYENGQKYSEINHKDGTKHGLQTYWHENGQKQKEITLKDGGKHSTEIRWKKNGQKQVEITRKNGKKHGLETWWDEEGNIIQQKRYENGQQVEKIK